MKNKQVNSQSSREDKLGVANAVYEYLSEFFFEKVNFISLPFTQSTTSPTVAGVTDTTNYNGSSRITDTAEGRFLDVGRQSRMKCNFYLTNYTKLDGYLLSPVIYDDDSSLNTISSLSVFRAYVGLRFLGGKIYTVAKEAGGTEVLREIELDIFGAGYTQTMALEILCNINSTEIRINSRVVGSYSTNFKGSFSSIQTFLPLLCPVKSSDGTSVNIVIENFQFIQDK